MKWTQSQMPDQSDRVAIVTGANSGIGYYTALRLAEKGSRVIMACRNPQKAEAARDRLLKAAPTAQVEFMPMDLSDLESVAEFATAFTARHDRLDLLINNAGVMMCPQATTKQGFEQQIGVNHFGHFALTQHLLPMIQKTLHSRIVVVASQAHRLGKMNFEDLHFERRAYKPTAAYGQSKLANLLFLQSLNRKLEASGSNTIAVAAHPGWTSTELQRHMRMSGLLNAVFAMKTENGALPTLRAATATDVKGGEYYGPCGVLEMRGHPKRVMPSQRAQDPGDAAKLWAISVESTGLSGF